MANEDIARLTTNLSKLEDEVAGLRERISRLEMATPNVRPVVPPPVVASSRTVPMAEPAPATKPAAQAAGPPPFPFPFSVPGAPLSASAQAPPAAGREASARPKTEDTEYRIGAVILPRVGAGVVLLAIGTFVSMAISRGWIDQWTQFWMGVFSCLAFIGVGLWKRNEQEEYGQLPHRHRLMRAVHGVHGGQRLSPSLQP